MNNTEVTVEIFEETQSVITKLKNQGFEFTESFSVCDYYFSKYDIAQLKEMEYKDIIDNSLILRKFFTEDEILEQKIVYKKKTLDSDGNVIADNKIQVLIDDIDKMAQLLKSVGLSLWCSMKNYVQTYSNGTINLDIHKVEDLGDFIELEEYQDIQHLSSEEKFEHLSNILMGLDLKIGTDFSCKKVYMKFQKENA